jgi:hypothetical protein
MILKQTHDFICSTPSFSDYLAILNFYWSLHCQRIQQSSIIEIFVAIIILEWITRPFISVAIQLFGNFQFQAIHKCLIHMIEFSNDRSRKDCDFLPQTSLKCYALRVVEEFEPHLKLQILESHSRLLLL